jgi:hypothetical protein
MTHGCGLKPMKIKEDRYLELKRLAALPNGTDKLNAILAESFIAFDKLPIATLMIRVILNYEYPTSEASPATVPPTAPTAVQSVPSGCSVPAPAGTA